MIRRPPSSTRTDTLFPYTTLFRSAAVVLVMLGPVAVMPELQRSGIGNALMQAALAVADRDGVGAIMLIGDAEYYGRYGFDAAPTQQWRLPGPFERSAQRRGGTACVSTCRSRWSQSN